jgi:hypothetical protein
MCFLYIEATPRQQKAASTLHLERKFESMAGAPPLGAHPRRALLLDAPLKGPPLDALRRDSPQLGALLLKTLPLGASPLKVPLLDATQPDSPRLDALPLSAPPQLHSAFVSYCDSRAFASSYLCIHALIVASASRQVSLTSEPE